MKWIFRFFYLILVALIIFVYKSWFLTTTIAAGDFWYFFPSMYDLHFLKPYAWYSFASVNGLGGSGFAYLNTSMVVSFVFLIANLFNLSWEIASKIFLFIPFLFISLVSSILLIKFIFPKNPLWIFAPIIFLFNSYIFMMVGGGQIITAISYSMIPLSILIMFKITQEINIFSGKNILYYAAFVFLFTLQCVFDIRIAFVTFIAIIIYLITAILSKVINLSNLFLFLSSFIFIALLNSYWLIPFLTLGVDPVRNLGSNYTSSEIVKFLSFAKIENSFGLLHPYWPENIFGKVGFMKAEFLLLPILAFSSLLFIRNAKNKKDKIYIIYFCLIALVGIFLGKGANEPLGNLYIWLFNNVPGFQLFRDSFKWYTLIILGFSILIPYSTYSIYNLLQKKDKLILKSKIFNLPNLFILFIFLYFIYLIHPAFFGNLNGTFKTRTVPENYKELNNFLSNQNEYFRTFWIPNTILFGYYSNSHPQISARDYLKRTDQEEIISEIKNPKFQEDLRRSSVKYVIVPEDSEKEIFLTDRKYDDKKYKDIISNLDQISWLKKVKSFNKIIVYENIGFKDHFWCNCNADIKYKFINPTEYEVNLKNLKNDQVLVFTENFDKHWVAQGQSFKVNSEKFDDKYNSFKIPADSQNIKIIYEPQKILDIGILISILGILFIVSLLVFSLVKVIKNDKIK